MPLTLEVADHAVRISARGTVTYQEVVDLIHQRVADPTRIPGLPVLVDGRGVTGAPSAPELRLIATQMKPLVDCGMGPIAVLTDSAFIYGIVRMFAVFAQAISANVSAHRRAEDAERWLSEQCATDCDGRREPIGEARRLQGEFTHGTRRQNRASA